MLTLTLVGLVIAGTGHWRTGIRFLGGALLFAAGIRVVLRPQDAGMLGVRHKLVDAFLLIVVGGLAALPRRLDPRPARLTREVALRARRSSAN